MTLPEQAHVWNCPFWEGGPCECEQIVAAALCDEEADADE